MKEASKPAHPKGVAPDFSGVIGVLVDANEVRDLQFAEKKPRVSPYDAQLRALAAAPGKVMRFDDVRALTSVKVRARKLGLKIELAFADGKMFVRVTGEAPAPEKGSTKLEDVLGAGPRHTRREELLSALKFGPASAMKLASILRAKGDTAIDAQLAGAILAQLARDGKVLSRADDTYALVK